MIQDSPEDAPYSIICKAAIKFTMVLFHYSGEGDSRKPMTRHRGSLLANYF
jgi:hypothetical protein